jgi:uncharacterized membrane-anchored protein
LFTHLHDVLAYLLLVFVCYLLLLFTVVTHPGKVKLHPNVYNGFLTRATLRISGSTTTVLLYIVLLFWDIRYEYCVHQERCKYPVPGIRDL